MIHIVLNGLQGPVDVHGVAFSGAVQMPAWKGVYTKDEDIAAVISFVRGNKDWGNNASAATPEQVKVIRDQLKDRDAMMSVQDLQKLPE
jgi:mono/diheme cytochrome c family protein